MGFEAAKNAAFSVAINAIDGDTSDDSVFDIADEAVNELHQGPESIDDAKEGGDKTKDADSDALRNASSEPEYMDENSGLIKLFC